MLRILEGSETAGLVKLAKHNNGQGRVNHVRENMHGAEIFGKFGMFWLTCEVC